MKLSMCIIVNKDSKYLEECLASLQSILKKIDSELIIIDTSSQDITVEIVKRYTDKVYFHKWNENFTEMINIANSYAKGEWLFILYGDEKVYNPEKLITFLNSGESKFYDTESVIMKSSKHENNDSYYGISQLSRLFRNQENCKYHDNVYNQNESKLAVADVDNVKLEQYKNQVKLQIEEFINDKKIDEAKKLINEYDRFVNDDGDIYSMKGIIAMLEEDFNKAEIIFKEGLEREPENCDLLYNLACLYQSKGQYKLSIMYFKQALQNTTIEKYKNEIREILREMETGINIDDQIIPSTSIIILTYNNLEYNKVCIESIRKYTKKGTYEIIVVDNNSTDGTVEWLKEQKDLKLILNNENLGFPKGCNQGIEASDKNNDILLLNNDTIVTPNWLNNLKLCLYSNKNIGSVGSVTNSCSNNQIIPAKYISFQEMVEFARNNNKSNPSLWEERVRLVGFCMLIKREVVNKIGLLDEIFTPGNFEDDDYSLRIRKARYKLVLCKDSFIHHFGSASFSKDSQKYVNLLNINREKFKNKWGIDPYSILDKQNIELKNSNNKNDNRKLKFLLRRIENDVDYNDSLDEIMNNIKIGNYNFEDIIMSVEKHGIKKEMLLNTIALECYKERMVDFSLQLLIKAHKINSADKDTIYNIAYIVNILGDKELAITFLNSVQDKDHEMIDLMREFTEEN